MSERADANQMDPDAAHAEPEFVRMLEEVFARADLSMPEPGLETPTFYDDESDKLYVGREFTSVAEFARWFAVQRLGSLPYNAVGYHHTENPTPATWAGLDTLTNIYDYYSTKWSPWGLGPHLWVYAGNGPWRSGTPHIFVGTHPAHDGAGILTRNGRWLHIEHVHNGDTAPFPEEMKRISGELLAVVCSRHPHANREYPAALYPGRRCREPRPTARHHVPPGREPGLVPGSLAQDLPRPPGQPRQSGHRAPRTRTDPPPLALGHP